MVTKVTLSSRAARKLDLVDAATAERLQDTLAWMEDDSVREARSVRLRSPLSRDGLVFSVRVGGNYRLLYTRENDNIIVMDVVTHQDFEKFKG